MVMDWNRFQRPPIAERKGRKVFVLSALGGIAFMVMALGLLSLIRLILKKGTHK